MTISRILDLASAIFPDLIIRSPRMKVQLLTRVYIPLNWSRGLIVSHEITGDGLWFQNLWTNREQRNYVFVIRCRSYDVPVTGQLVGLAI